MERKYGHIRVELELGEDPEVWAVLGLPEGCLLGEIRWYAPWERFCFVPFGDTVWSPECLTDIMDALAWIQRERRGGDEGGD